MMGVDQVYAPGYEADDVGSFLSLSLNVPMVLMSNDKDWLQLVRPGVSIWQRSKTSKPKPNMRMLITAENFADTVGYPSPRDFLRGKCIEGDGSDSVPGINGVGPVTILNYLCGRDLHSARCKRILDFVETDSYARNVLLMDLQTLKPDVGNKLVWDRGQKSDGKVWGLLNEYNFASIIKKFPAWWEMIDKATL